MSFVVLEVADIGLFADFEATRVELLRLREAPATEQFDQALSTFYGDTRATSFRGLGESRSRQLGARYMTGEHQHAVDLMELLRSAHRSVDGRLLLRTPLGEVAGLDPVDIVVVADPVMTPVDYRTWDVSFTAHSVDYTIEV